MSHNPLLLELLPREARILLLTAGDESNDPALRALLTREPSWEDLLTLLEWERSLPASWTRLKGLGIDTSGPGAAALERISRVSEFSAMTLEDRLLRLIRAFADEEIPAILLKGAGLALSAYDRFADRPMGDLDVLVSPRHARRAWEIALAQSWVWDENEYPQRHYQAHHHLPPLVDSARTGARLELHTALSLSSHPFSFSFEEAHAVSMAAPRGVAPGLHGARVLDVEHNLIHVAVHFAWGHLATLGIWRLARDIVALSRQSIDWNRVGMLAEKHRAGLSLYWSLRLADQLCGVNPAPPELLRAIAPRRSKWVLKLLERHLAVHVINRITPCPSEKLRQVMWSMALAPEETTSSSV
ncbi:MAG: nucleotidyltransferase family protein, partial [Gemmatimonadaceae bacterium]